MPKNFDHMSDVLGFADGVDAGSVLKFYRATEFYFDGIRLNPGTYELRKVQDDKSSSEEPAF